MDHPRPTPVDLTDSSSVLLMLKTPFRIPPSSAETRLERAYERLGAFEEEDYTANFTEINGFCCRVMDRLMEKDEPSKKRCEQFGYVQKECEWRGWAVREIKKALNYELALAKEEAGQYPCTFPKPKLTVQDWDSFL